VFAILIGLLLIGFFNFNENISSQEQIKYINETITVKDKLQQDANRGSWTTYYILTTDDIVYSASNFGNWWKMQIGETYTIKRSTGTTFWANEITIIDVWKS
jgi:hypothetical protein